MESNPYASPAGSATSQDTGGNTLPWLLTAFALVTASHGLLAIAAYLVHEWKLPTDFSKPSDSAWIVWMINAPVALFVNAMIASRLYPRLSLYVPVVCGVIALPFLPVSLITIVWIVNTARGV